MSDMLITMCVIAYNEEQNINGILECIKNQDYDHNNMEVVLVDGASTDNTRALMCEFALDNKDEFRRVVVLDNPKKTLPSGWNVALREYKGDAIIKVDAHAVIPEDFVSKNVRVLETGEYILSIVKRIKPNAVVVIDALASRRLERLGCTLQISDTGISPGAGVGNHRTKINKETIGVPVIAIGVPTVVDAATFASDLLSVNDPHRARQKITPQGRQMVVIPREIDLLTERASRLISFALNGALQNEFNISELVSLM